MKNVAQYAKQWVVESLKLMKNFKWGIGSYCFYFWILLSEYFNPPAVDDPIFRAEAFRNLWAYTNYEVYMGSLVVDLKYACIFFLFAASNMRNHPKLATFLFWSPWILGIFNLIIECFK